MRVGIANVTGVAHTVSDIQAQAAAAGAQVLVLVGAASRPPSHAAWPEVWTFEGTLPPPRYAWLGATIAVLCYVMLLFLAWCIWMLNVPGIPQSPLTWRNYVQLTVLVIPLVSLLLAYFGVHEFLSFGGSGTPRGSVVVLQRDTKHVFRIAYADDAPPSCSPLQLLRPPVVLSAARVNDTTHPYFTVLYHTGAAEDVPLMQQEYCVATWNFTIPGALATCPRFSTTTMSSSEAQCRRVFPPADDTRARLHVYSIGAAGEEDEEGRGGVAV